MKHVQDERIDDLFFVPQPSHPAPGFADYSLQVSHLVSELLKGCEKDRYQIAAEVSRLVGRDISKHILDCWASPGRTDHNLPFAVAPVLESVCGSHALTDWTARQAGGRVAYGRETLKAKMATALLKKQKADAEYKQLQRMLGEDEQ